MIELRRDILFRDAQAARMARLFGDTDFGLVFYAETGEALPVSEDERNLFLTQARRATEAHIVDQQCAAIMTVILALAFFFAFHGAQQLLGRLIPAILLIPGFLAVGPALATPMIASLLYRRRLRRLRRDFAERLQFRTEIPRAIAQPHRRYNLFAVGSLVAAILGCVLWLMKAIGGYNAAGPQWILYLAPAWILHFAARRIDRVHRRLPEELGRLR